MNVIYSLLLTFHVVGVLFNLLLMMSCFRDKEKYTLLQKSRAVIIFQSVLHVALLALGAHESMKTFSDEEQWGWCTTDSALIIFVSFGLVYNLLAMLSIEYHTMICLKRPLSPLVAMLGTLIAGISTPGFFFWAGFFTDEELCISQTASTVASTLLLVLLLSIVWQVCTQTEHAATKTKSSTDSSHGLLNSLRKSKASVSVTALFLFCVGLALFLEAIRSNAGFEEIEQLKKIMFFERVFYLYIMCFGVGISLPVIFLQIIDSSANDEQTDEHCNEKILST